MYFKMCVVIDGKKVVTGLGVFGWAWARQRRGCMRDPSLIEWDWRRELGILGMDG